MYHKYTFDYIFLITDDDGNYQLNDPYINDITIRIDHSYQIRNPKIGKFIAVRPFKINNRNWALPCYPAISKEEKLLLIKDNKNINITILGSAYGYDLSIINRMSTVDFSKIVIHVISRISNADILKELDASRFEIHVYENITTERMINILEKTNYILTDVANQPKYETDMMAGAIPFAFSTLSQLILSEKSNSYYKFKNVIEFRDGNNDIMLNQNNIDFNSFVDERSELIEMFKNEINKIIDN
jgi:hypothetical protein